MNNNSYPGICLSLYPLDFIIGTISAMDLLAYLTMKDKTDQNDPKRGP